MGSFSGVIIGLSFVFGFIFFGLIAELYYFLWWKKRVTINNGEETEEDEEEINNHTPFLSSSIFCWKKPTNCAANNSESTRQLNSTISRESEQDLELGNSKDSLLKGLVGGEESVESELMRIHNLWGPPRFLFTIKEETKEELEEDAKSKGERSRKGSRTRSLSDVVIALDNNNNTTPFLSPLSSPTIKISPSILDCYGQRGVNFNPLYESFTESDLNKLRSSPPPKFKFLRDAEEKLIKRLVEEAEKRGIKNWRNSERGGVHEQQVATATIHHHHSGPSQVLPLASSPTKIRPLDRKCSPQQDIVVIA